jgi:hypothetical protein
VTGEAPKTREELADHLDSLGVRSDCYHLFGAHLEDAFVLDHRPEGWVVFYSERGGEWSPKVFDSEAAACSELLARVAKEDHCFFELVAGPAPANQADEAWAAWLDRNRISVDHLEERDWKTDDVPWVPGPYWRRYFVRTTTVRRLTAAPD